MQKSILATSQNEKPFDIFICYKESEEDGSRTRDSIMAAADSFTDYDEAYNMFRRLNGYKDSDELAGRCADYRYKPPKKKKGIFGR